MKKQHNNSHKIPWLKIIGIVALYVLLFYALIFTAAPFVGDEVSDGLLCFLYIAPAIITAAIVWLINKKFSKKVVIDASSEAVSPLPYKDGILTKENYRVTGVMYYTENVMKLAVSNPDWKCTTAKIIKDGKANKRIFRYNFINKPVKLIPEPTNEHDKNAVMVMIAGEKVGYISREYSVHVKELLETKEIKYISAGIHGGQYKVVDDEKNMTKEENQLEIFLTIAYV